MAGLGTAFPADKGAAVLLLMSSRHISRLAALRTRSACSYFKAFGSSSFRPYNDFSFGHWSLSLTATSLERPSITFPTIFFFFTILIGYFHIYMKKVSSVKVGTFSVYLLYFQHQKQFPAHNRCSVFVKWWMDNISNGGTNSAQRRFCED